MKPMVFYGVFFSAIGIAAVLIQAPVGFAAHNHNNNHSDNLGKKITNNPSSESKTNEKIPHPLSDSLTSHNKNVSTNIDTAIKSTHTPHPPPQPAL